MSERYSPSQLDQQLGSILEGWINRDVRDDQCRFCNAQLDDEKPAADRYCDEECEEDFGTVMQARLALGRRDLNQRGYD